MSDSTVPPPETSRPAPSLRQRALRGSLWWAAAYPLVKLIQIAGSIVLARLLSPAAFGVVAIASILLRAVQMFSEVGVGYALIRSPRVDEAFVNTAWTLQAARGLVVLVASAALAYPVASFYGEPQILVIMPVIGMSALAVGLSSTKYVTLNRTLRERPRALILVGHELAMRASMIGCALIWPRAASIVVGILAADVLFSLATHALPGPRNRLHWDPSAAKEIWSNGSWLTVGAIVAYLGGQLDTLIVGPLVSSHLGALGLVGVYQIAQRVAALPGEAVGQLAGPVFLPVLSELARRDRRDFRAQLVRIRSAALPLGVALCFGVVAFAPAFFAVFYDQRYAAAGWMAQVMVGTVWIGLLELFTNKSLLALTRVRVLALAGGIRAIVGIAGAVVGSSIAGLPGFIVGLSAGALAQLAIEHVELARCGSAVWKQDVAQTAVLAVLTGISAWAQSWAAHPALTSPSGLAAFTVPAALFAAYAGWAGRRAYRLLRGERRRTNADARAEDAREG